MLAEALLRGPEYFARNERRRGDLIDAVGAVSGSRTGKTADPSDARHRFEVGLRVLLATKADDLRPEARANHWPPWKRHAVEVDAVARPVTILARVEVLLSDQRWPR